MYDLQDGIYYDRTAGGSFVIVSLKVTNGTTTSDLGQVLSGLWNMFHELKKGIVLDLDVHPKHRHGGNLTVLLGFGPKMFDGSIKGLRRAKPKEISNNLFLQPRLSGGGPIAIGSGINFSSDTKVNHFALDHLVLQFIGDTELITNRPVTETWKYIKFKSKKSNIIKISRIYKGFEREDKRGWLGFHDGISNMKTQERLGAIQINGGISNQSNDWLFEGTYLSFHQVRSQLRALGKSKYQGTRIHNR